MAKEREIVIRTEFRLFIMFKYFFVGLLDICFWWSTWNISDHLYPPQLRYGYCLTMLRGYALIIMANLTFILFRTIFNDIFLKSYDHTRQEIFETVIVQYTNRRKHKSIHFRILRLVFPIFPYALTVGMINIWRGLFQLFPYIVELLQARFDVHTYITSFAFIFISGLILSITQRSNAVNLTPAHKMYSFDELEYLDQMFFLYSFSTFEPEEPPKASTDLQLPESDQYYSMSNSRYGKKKCTLFHHDFDLIQYVALKFLKKLHTKMPCKIPPDVVGNTDIKPYINASFVDEHNDKKQVQESTLHTRMSCKIPPDVVGNTDIKPYINVSFIDENSDKKQVQKSVFSTELFGQCLMQDIKSDAHEKLDELYMEEEPKQPYQVRSPNQRKDIENQKGKFKSTQDACNCVCCKFIVLFAYLGAIHLRHVFLQSFGGMFWSNMWYLFDQTTESIINVTMSDVPFLIYIAFSCHCFSQLVLFRFRENAAQLHWKTFYEILLGVMTVFMWASLWYVLDRLADLTGDLLKVYIGVHIASFGILALFGVSINCAL